MDCPRLRPIQVLPIQHQGQRRFLLQDPEGHATQSLTVTAPALAAIQMMNGANSLRDIQAAFFRRFGEMLFTEDLDALVAQLDDLLLLDSDRFRETRERALAEFRARPVRDPIGAGSSYPADPDALREHLAGLFAETGFPEPEPTRGDLAGLIAPHIDTGRGGAVYAAGYKELAERADAETFVLLGTNHAPGRAMVIATGKPFATPLGTTAVDAELLAALIARFPGDLSAEEIAHRAEHSIEFQVLLLQSVMADRPYRILPILCNSPLAAPRDESTDAAPAFAAFARATREAVAATGRRVVYVAGADLAHIGAQFGDANAIDAHALAECERRDRAMLAFAVDRDADGFGRFIRDEGDRRRICGWGPIDALLRCIDADSGKLLRYGQWADNGGHGSVTFASVAFYRDGKEGP
jgi:AmmeMemoRadiSam system protein B